MRDSTGIAIKSAIAHLIEPRRAGGFVLSERALPLGTQKALRQFFCDHIENNLSDVGATAAKFNGSTGNILQTECAGLLSGKGSFVKRSVRIAEHLHSIMKADQRISDGVLVIATYTTSNNPGRFVALLKLDPSEVFQPTTRTDKSGRKYVTFKTIQDVIPTTGERLQKCAFVRIPPKAVDYDMMLVDLQHRGDPQPARFFRQDFLGAEPFRDAQSMTRDFYTAAIGALNDIRSEIGPVKAEQVRLSIDAAVNSTTIDVVDWIAKLPIKKAAKQVVEAAIQPVTPTRKFHTDPKMAQRMTRQRVLKGDNGLRISLPTGYFDQMVKQKKKSGPHGDYWELVITTSTLEDAK